MNGSNAAMNCPDRAKVGLPILGLAASTLRMMELWLPILVMQPDGKSIKF